MIAVVANKGNGVRELTLKQVEGIFTGDVSDWSEVGGNAGKISIYTRNTASGTYKTFQKRP
ncbi:MAG: phosphate transport system substrate-binding protein [Verrucomicrobiales bacterium]|jgi:phosphate transport system substrate-binding protein